jgi:hypothetical protein
MDESVFEAEAELQHWDALSLEDEMSIDVYESRVCMTVAKLGGVLMIGLECDRPLIGQLPS